MRISNPPSLPASTPVGWRRTSLAASLVAGHLVLAGNAWADTASAVVDSIDPKRIEVLSNGVVYTQPAVALVSLSASLVVNIDAETSGHIKSWKAWISVSPGAPGLQSSVEFSQHPYSKSYPLHSRPKTVSTRGVSVNVPYGALRPFLVEHCNWLANDLHSKGMSNQAIFSQDRVIPVRVTGYVEADISGIGLQVPQEVDFGGTKTFELVCKAQGGVNPDIGPVAGDLKIQPEARLTSVTASVLHDSHPASCPTEATARVTFVSDTDGPFTWRFTSASGKVSAPIRMEMRASDKQGNLYIRSHNQKFMVGEAATSTHGGGSSGGIGGGAVGGGFAGTTQPDPEMPGQTPSGASHQQVGGGFAAPTLPRLHQDALRAVVLNAAAGSVERSDAASYKVQCPVGINPAVGKLPGEMQGSTPAAGTPSRAIGVLVPGAVKTAPPGAGLPPGVRKPALPAQLVLPTVVPATPVARLPVPTTDEGVGPSGRTPRIGAIRRDAAEERRNAER